MFMMPMLMKPSTGGVDYEAEVDALLSGTTGWAVDLADTSTVFTDTGGTTPVTTPGDGIGRLNSKFGTTAYNWTQATNKPLWNGASQQTDGTNDLVQTTSWSGMNNVAGVSFTIRFLVDDLSVNRSLFSCSTATGTVPRFGIRLESSGAILLYGRRLDADPQFNFTTATGLITTGVEYTLQCVQDYAGTGDVEILLDGSSVLTDTMPGSPANTSNTNSARCRWSLNTSNTLNDWFDGKTGSAIMAVSALGPADLANCRGYVERNAL